jgi:hypothetical protein
LLAEPPSLGAPPAELFPPALEPAVPALPARLSAPAPASGSIRAQSTAVNRVQADQIVRQMSAKAQAVRDMARASDLYLWRPDRRKERSRDDAVTQARVAPVDRI